jgi:asparagine synthase (glutamine-hydrolysing)
MCGIWALINHSNNNIHNNNLNHFWNIKHRGPDNSHLMAFANMNSSLLHNSTHTFIGFHRLAIMDISSASNQPYIIHENNKTIIFICNGEIYNYKELDQKYNLNINNSDCLSIPKLYLKMNSISEWYELFKEEIKGEFAFMLFEFDSLNILNKYFVGRDMVGVRPLYCSIYNNIFTMYSSEIKGIPNDIMVKEFTPGTIQMIVPEKQDSVFDFTTIYNIKQNMRIEDESIYLDKIKNSVIASIKRRLCTDRPIAFLLSGGVDSSLVASISSQILGQRIKTFCCGIKGSTDMIYAKLVAEHINSIHTEVYFTEEEGLDAIDDVIYTTETWDTTTIRASVGQYLVSKYISKNTDCKVVMVGEGPDEVCSSYLFNYYAPTNEKLHSCAEEYVKNIHMYDGKRADRCIAKWGMEARIPFLDPEFINTYWNIPSNMRHPKYNMEKYLLRKAFEGDYLPHQVLWRKKEAFSDGISSKENSWFSIIQNYIKTKITHNESNNDLTLEAKYYKMIFNKYFGNRDTIISKYWQPKWDKEGNEISTYVDPSARTLSIY